MIARRIEALLARVDGSGSREESRAVRALKGTKEGLSHWLLHHYRTSRNWKARRSCAYFATFDRASEDALTLGREAIRDRSKHVRYRACQLLAQIQRKDVLPDLRKELAALRDGPGADDVRAAIDAIESENRHYFLDREHTGKVRGYTFDEFMDLLDAGKAPPADVPQAPGPKRRRGK